MSSFIRLLLVSHKPRTPASAWLPSQLAPGIPSPPPKHWGDVGFYLGSRGPNSGPLVSLASSLSTQTSPQPLRLFVTRLVVPRSMVHFMNLGGGTGRLCIESVKLALYHHSGSCARSMSHTAGWRACSFCESIGNCSLRLPVSEAY